MCTLTYIPISKTEGDFILTDNRDESVNRPAKWPEVYEEMETELFYPKDIQAGGTWFGVSKQKRAMALLNGAFRPHKHHNKNYRKSRGIVVKELLASKNLRTEMAHYDFTGIEAFYGVIFDWSQSVMILEVVWDGKQLFLQENKAEQAHIWSSAMTFSPEEHQRKKDRFEKFIKMNSALRSTAEETWDFHHLKDGKGDMVLDHGILKTTSISQLCHFDKENDFFRHKNLLTGEEQEDMIVW